nr:MAG TPA: hypothetical protein [Caudoviricetes sp.]
MCNHSYTTKSRTYYDKNQQCRIRIETDTCIFCCRKSAERRIAVKDPPKRRLPYFGPHLCEIGEV